MRTRSGHPPQAFHPARIGPYEVLRRLGAGAMGEVFLARSASARLVAVKTIRAGLAEHPGYRRRFAHEVDAARRVSGAFTAAVVDADPHADLPWLATVYVPAPSLEELVASCGPLPVPAVRWLAAGCAEALQAVHQVGLVHRDLKPANVLVTADGPRVIDFGLARTDGLPQGTVAGMVLGTPWYMAPEQAAGNTHTGPAADVFSLGATLIHACTGAPPYREAKGMGAILQMMTEPPDLAAVPDELRDVLGSCLAVRAEARPTPVELISVLAPHLSGVETAPPLPADVLDHIEDHRDTQMELARPRRSGGDSGSGGAGASQSHDGGGTDGLGAGGRVGPVSHAESVSTVGRAAEAETGIDASSVGVSTPGMSHPSLLPAETFVPPRRSNLLIGTAAVATGVTLAVVTLIFAVLIVTGAVHFRGSGSGNGNGGGGGHPAAGPPAASALPQWPGDGPPGGPPGGPPPGAYTESAGISLAIQPPFGDPHTTFVIHGRGWPPGASVTISVVDTGVPTRTVVDGNGTFNYAVNQHHELFAGDLPDGRYRIRAVAGSVTETVSFVIGPPLTP